TQQTYDKGTYWEHVKDPRYNVDVLVLGDSKPLSEFPVGSLVHFNFKVARVVEQRTFANPMQNYTCVEEIADSFKNRVWVNPKNDGTRYMGSCWVAREILRNPADVNL